MAEKVLSEEQCACLDQVLQSIANTRALIAQCKDCGIPMEQVESELDAQEKLAQGLKRNFFPQRV